MTKWQRALEPLTRGILGFVVLGVMATTYVGGFFVVVEDVVTLVGWAVLGLVPSTLLAFLAAAPVMWMESRLTERQARKAAEVHRELARLSDDETLCADCSHLERAHADANGACSVPSCRCGRFAMPADWA